MGDLTRNLSRSEFACNCGCGFDTVDFDLPKVIQDVVDHYQHIFSTGDIRVKITSGSRCKKYSKLLNLSVKSQHVFAKAADITIYDKISGKEIPTSDVAAYLEQRYPTSHGIGRYHTHTHIDVRKIKARWDNRK